MSIPDLVPGSPPVALTEGAGLDEAEAARRLARFGLNDLNRAPSRSVWAITRGALREPMFILLLVASGLYLVLGDLGEGLFMTAGAAVAVGLVILQEARSERALKALRELGEPFARVIRGGAQKRVPVRELVPGDLVLVGEGQRIPADCWLLSGDLLSVDESALTGESASVFKTPGLPLAKAGDAGEEGASGALQAGTLIVRGYGRAQVLRTGADTAIGRIGTSLATLGDEATPLQKSTSRLVVFMGSMAFVVCGLMVVAHGLLRGDWVAGILAGLTLAIALIPEEFPMILTVFTALGAWRLARHQVLVRRGAVIESLGAATLLCVDKTGTLTENRMAVARLWGRGAAWEAASGQPQGAAAELLRIAAEASNAESVDPMDRAVLELERAAAAPRENLRPVRTWPLSPARPALVQTWSGPDGETAAAKGAPEAIFRLCRLSPQESAQASATVERWAQDGLRVLALASAREMAPSLESPDHATFVFEGLIGFVDPVRPEAPAALREARAAGISVAMITGDYPATALAIARECGLDVTHGVLTGPEIARLDAETLREQVRFTRVFARVQPEQKLRLVQAFKANGAVVAMTGDGVNDAPALQAADIGIAMGRRGADVAREAADLVLLDDSFASIVGGVRLGRRIFANLRKALTYVTAIHFPIAGLALGPVLLGLPPLLTPLHVVLLELVIDPVCSLVFEAEPSEAGAMRRPPRRAGEALFGRRQFGLAMVQGLVILAAVLGLYLWALGAGSEQDARGAAFTALVIANLVLALADASTGERLFSPRRLVFWSILAAAASGLSVMLFAPAAAALLQVSPSGLLVTALPLAVAAGGWYAAWSAVRRARGSQSRAGASV